MLITILYILIMMAGIAWLVYRISIYVQKERERESRLNQTSLLDDQFKAYLDRVKKQQQSEMRNGS
jgi:hypothetical protein